MVDILKRKEICHLYDTTNMTIEQVARWFGMKPADVKKILMDDAWGGR